MFTFLSVGPVDLTIGKLILLFKPHFWWLSYTFYHDVGTLDPHDKTAIPTVTQNLFTDQMIGKEVLSVSFEPLDDPTGDTQMNGVLTWGVYIYYLNL